MKSSINILVDSSAELTESMLAHGIYTTIPFHVYNHHVEIFHHDDVNEKNSAISSACPSPQRFINALLGHDESYIVTMGASVSGSYNSANIAKEHMALASPKAFVHVFDSGSASACQTLIAMKIHELANKGIKREALVNEVNDYIDALKTLFISESLDNLERNGRLTSVKIKLASILQLKFLMTTNEDNEIILIRSERSLKKAHQKFKACLKDASVSSQHKLACISHINNLEGAESFKHYMIDELGFKEVIITSANLINSVYCGNRGIIVSF